MKVPLHVMHTGELSRAEWPNSCIDRKTTYFLFSCPKGRKLHFSPKANNITCPNLGKGNVGYIQNLALAISIHSDQIYATSTISLQRINPLEEKLFCEASLLTLCGLGSPRVPRSPFREP